MSICPLTREIDDATLRQDADLLRLPDEVLKCVGTFIATGDVLNAGKSAVQWGRVCVLTHRLSHEKDLNDAMERARLATIAQREIMERWDAENRIFIY